MPADRTLSARTVLFLRRRVRSEAIDAGTIRNAGHSVFRCLTASVGFMLILVGSYSGSTLAADGSPSEDARLATVDARWQCTEPKNNSPVSIETSLQESDGVVFERLRLVAGNDLPVVRAFRGNAPARITPELKLAVPVRADGCAIRAGLQIVFPHQLDPRTRETLTTIHWGDILETSDEWTPLTVQCDSTSIAALIRRLRTELHRSEINTADAFADAVVIEMELRPGESFADLGKPELGPFQAAAVDPVVTSSTPARSGVRLDTRQLKLNDTAIFLRVAPYQGESIATLKALGVNAVWVPSIHDTHLLDELEQAGILIVATPPHPDLDPSDYKSSLTGLVPFTAESGQVSIWYLGTRIDASQLPHFAAWSRAVMSADRHTRRLLMADFQQGERAASYHVDLLGMGTSVIGQAIPFGGMRNTLLDRRNNAGADVYSWCWIQTEPPHDVSRWFEAAGYRAPQLQYEQLTLQTYAAISAGCRGLGFWRSTPARLDAESATESDLAIRQLNMELALLEPFLAAGRLEGHIPVTIGHQNGSASGTLKSPRGNGSFLSRLNGSNLSLSVSGSEPSVVPDAAVIRSAYGRLIVPVFWDVDSQIAPAGLFAQNAKLVVAAHDTDAAWLISPTEVSPLKREFVPGGMEIELENFDQRATILVTSDLNAIRQLRARVRQMQDTSAETQLAMARSRATRVDVLIDSLTDFGPAPFNAAGMIQQARWQIERAETFLRTQRPDASARASITALRILRRVQRLFWQAVAAGHASNLSSPFITWPDQLPLHRKMLDDIATRSSPAQRGIPFHSGDFERQESLQTEEWLRKSGSQSEVTAISDVIHELSGNNAFLRLMAWPNPQATNGADRSDDPQFEEIELTEPPIMVATPAFHVKAGDVVRITGRSRHGRTVPTSPFSASVFCSELGSEAAVPVAESSAWKQFECFRRPASDGAFRFTFMLSEFGEVHVDDVQITVFRDRAKLTDDDEVTSTGSAVSVSPSIPHDRTARDRAPLTRGRPSAGSQQPTGVSVGSGSSSRR